MRTILTWLHISDIHFNKKTGWRDSVATDSIISYLSGLFKEDLALRPDLIFCTGDISFGETGSDPLVDQYKAAKFFFDKLLIVCGQEGTPLEKGRLFVVPGNHDINRKSVNEDAQETLTAWAADSTKHAAKINQRFEDRSVAFTDAIRRLNDYAQFVDSYLPHQVDKDGRHCFTNIVPIDGLNVGIAGFNSAWSCAGPEDDRSLWLAAEWQFNAAKRGLEEAYLRIGLMHHPVDWLNPTDRELSTRRISTDFDFWLHGHSHSAWVMPGQSNITIAAGAVGADTSDEFGINLVQIDLLECNGNVYLHKHRSGGSSWTTESIEEHAPKGQWPLERLSSRLRKTAPVTPPSISAKMPNTRESKLFGRQALLKDAKDKLTCKPFLLVYGLRGNGKTSLIKELTKIAPLTGKEPIPLFTVTPSTTADELFRQLAAPLGETAEFPKAPQGDAATIAAEIMRRYPNPRPAWVWIDRAHHLLTSDGFNNPQIRNLLLGLNAALGTQWHWVLELRERPPKGLIGSYYSECEVPGLDKASLSECLVDAAPVGRKADWTYTGDKLKSIYQWLGGGQGNQAHPQAIQLLIAVADGCDETPLAVLQRHRGTLEEEIESKLLGDLYYNVLSPLEQKMIQALSLYRTSIPHDHAEALEKSLEIPGAWDGLDRRCLLSSSADHSRYSLHSFIAAWLRTRCLGYGGHGEDDEADFAESTMGEVRNKARALHGAIASAWLAQLGGSRRVTNTNITRALEAFHHLLSAGEGGRVQTVAVELLAGNFEWARHRIERFSFHLYDTNAPVSHQREALEFWVTLEPGNNKLHCFLGQCWQKEEGTGSRKAIDCFENACRLREDYPPNWANLGKALLATGRAGAVEFLTHLERLEQDCPQAIDGHVRAIQANCFKLEGKKVEAAAVRMERIGDGSGDSVFYNDEAKARLDAGNLTGALEILDLADKNGCADDFTAAIRDTILMQTDPTQAAALRMERIGAGSRSTLLYFQEAKVRLAAGNLTGALEILDLADKNGCADDFTRSMRSTILQQTDPAQAAAFRMEIIGAGSRKAAFYVQEAKVRGVGGNLTGALEILDLADKNGCADDFTRSMRSTILQQTDPAQAAAFRMEEIGTGSRNAVIYVQEAKARLAAGNSSDALEIIDLADKNGCTNDFTRSMRGTILQQTDPAQAAAFRMEIIGTGSRNAAIYVQEAKVRLTAGNSSGALEILDLAGKNGCDDDFTVAMRCTILQQTDSAQAAAFRMEIIGTGSRNAAIYVQEAKARLDVGNPTGALEILDLADKNGCADDFTAAIRDTILMQTDPTQAAALRMERIGAGSRSTLLYFQEAKVRLAAGNLTGALEILDLADKNGCADDFTRSMRSTILQQTDPAQAAAFRMEIIGAGSRKAAFYVQEAKVRGVGGNLTGALEILDLADKNGCADDFTRSMRSTILQQTDPAQAAAFRMEEIGTGSRNAVIYVQEAKARLAAGNSSDALEIIDLADKNGCTNDFTRSMRGTILQQTDPAQAAAFRMEIIGTGSRNAAIYVQEAKVRLTAGNSSGALEILDLAGKNGCDDNFTVAMRGTILQQTDPAQAAAFRMEMIGTGSRNAAIYVQETKVRLAAGNSSGALEILDLADKNGCTNDFTKSIRSTILQQADPAQAAAFHMEIIGADSHNAAIYVQEAKVRLAAGNSSGALEILDLAGKNGCDDEFTAAVIRGTTSWDLQ